MRNGKEQKNSNISFANELGKLLNNVGTIIPTGTNTLKFQRKSNVSTKKKVIYCRIVPSIYPQREDMHHTRFTTGGNVFDYHGDTSTPTTDLTTTKINNNSVIFTPKAKFSISYIENFILIIFYLKMNE